MLDPWIIEEIKRREQKRSRIEQPVVQIPAHGPEPRDREEPKKRREDSDDPPRGVDIIDFGGDFGDKAYGW